MLAAEGSLIQAKENIEAFLEEGVDHTKIGEVSRRRKIDYSWKKGQNEQKQEKRWHILTI